MYNLQTTIWGLYILKITRRSLLKAGSALAISAKASSIFAGDLNGKPTPLDPKASNLRISQQAKSRLRNSDAPTITFLGDSNSHGVGAVDIYRNSYVNIIKRLINYEHGSENYGYAPLMSTGTGDYFSQDIHEISFLAEGGRKNSWISCEGRSGSHVPQGLSFVSFESGNIIATTVPTFQRRIKIWYISNNDCGSFIIRLNGNAVTVVNTYSQDLSPLSSVTVDLYDGHYEAEGLPFPALTPGLCRVECVTNSEKKVEICGFSYVSSEKSLTVNNFSNSGRRLCWIDDLAIKKIIENTDVLVMALSYNDAFDNSNDESYFSEYKSKIDSIIKYARQFHVSVIVADFIWDEVASNLTRIELRRLAQESDGIYIPFPEIFSPDGLTPSWRYRMNEVKMFFEPAHLNIYGHECVSDVLGSYMGLGSTSKEFALSSCDWWFPLKLLGTGIQNSGADSDSVSAVRSIAKGLGSLRLGITGINSNIKRGLCQQWPSRSGISGVATTTHPLEARLDGSAQGLVEVSSSGQITACPNNNNSNSTHNILAVFKTE